MMRQGKFLHSNYIEYHLIPGLQLVLREIKVLKEQHLCLTLFGTILCRLKSRVHVQASFEAIDEDKAYDYYSC